MATVANPEIRTLLSEIHETRPDLLDDNMMNRLDTIGNNNDLIELIEDVMINLDLRLDMDDIELLTVELIDSNDPNYDIEKIKAVSDNNHFVRWNEQLESILRGLNQN